MPVTFIGGSFGTLTVAAYQAVGSTAYAAASTVAIAFPSGIATNDILIVQVLESGSGGDGTNPDVDSGFSLLTGGAHTGNNIAGAIWWKRATGSESGTVTASHSNGTPTSIGGRMYRFNTAQAAGTPFEASTTTSQTSSTTVNQLSLTSLDVKRLGLHFVSYLNTNTITAFTGESNGDFTEPVAEGTNTSMGFQLQTADMPTAVTISGGTATLGTASIKMRHVTAILPGIV